MVHRGAAVSERALSQVAQPVVKSAFDITKHAGFRDGDNQNRC
jgi:hypothetical protein